ncbi:MAG: hypothetical protein AB1765_13510, partial [Candidatus Hydrogenedentota bacterium]
EKIISLPGKPAGFEFKVIKDEVYSGEAFEFELNIVDKFNNRVDVKPLLKEISDTRIYLKIISGMEEKFSSEIITLDKFIDGEFKGKATYSGLSLFQIEIFSPALGLKTTSRTLNSYFGPLKRFKIELQDIIFSGEPFIMNISALDAADNVIESFCENEGAVELFTSGDGKFSPALVPLSEFKRGRAKIEAVYEKSGEITITVKDITTGIETKTEAVNIFAGRTDNFKIVLPNSAKAGDNIPIKIEAYDEFNNLVTKYSEFGNDVEISSIGEGVMIPAVISSSEFINGVAKIEGRYYIAEKTRLVVAERNAQSRGYSEEIEILPDIPQSIELSYNTSYPSAEPVEIQYFVLDKYANLTKQDQEIKLKIVDAKSGVDVPIKEGDLTLKNTSGIIKLLFNRAGETVLRVLDDKGKVWFESGKIYVSPGPPAKVNVSYPDEIKVGEIFQLILEVVDGYGNRCVDLNKRKGMVSLTTNSNIKLVPEKINFSDFDEGLFKGHFVSLEIGEIEIVPELNIGVSCEKEVNLIKYYPGI